MKEIMDIEMFYLLILSDLLEKMDIGIDDIESIKVDKDNITIQLKGQMKTVNIDLEVSE